MILNGWKEIANYMGRGVRTVQRWEGLGLPLHRPHARLRSAVVTTSDELDGWLAACVKGRQESPAAGDTARNITNPPTNADVNEKLGRLQGLCSEIHEQTAILRQQRTLLQASRREQQAAAQVLHATVYRIGHKCA